MSWIIPGRAMPRRPQTIAWERLVDGDLLPLCDRVATRID